MLNRLSVNGNNAQAKLLNQEQEIDKLLEK